MSERPKPKSNAVLMNLPAERQEQIAEWCRKANDVFEGKVIPGTGGLAFARSQLDADGLKVSLDTLSRFFSWWELEQDLDLSFEVQDQVLARTGNVKAAREAGEEMLIRLGMAKKDPKVLAIGVQAHDSRRSLDLQEETGRTKARQGDARLEVARENARTADRRVRLLEENQAAAKAKLTAVAAKGGLTPETLKQIEEAVGLL